MRVEFGVRSDVVKGMMSVSVRLVREIDESFPRGIGQPTADCLFWRGFPGEGWLHGKMSSCRVQGGAEGTEECVLAPHTEVRERWRHFLRGRTWTSNLGVMALTSRRRLATWKDEHLGRATRVTRHRCNPVLLPVVQDRCAT